MWTATPVLFEAHLEERQVRKNNPDQKPDKSRWSMCCERISYELHEECTLEQSTHETHEKSPL